METSTARNLEDIFNICLDRIMAGESLDACLADYPEWAEELKSLLEVTGQVMHAAQGAEADAVFREGLKRRVLQSTPSRNEGRAWNWRVPMWATSLAVVVLVVVGAGGAIVGAATGSQPDQLLYRVKIGMEQVQLALTPDSGKEDLRLQQAETRAQEIAYLADKNETGLIDSVAGSMEAVLSGQSAGLAASSFSVPSSRNAAPVPQDTTSSLAPMAAPLTALPPVVPKPEGPSSLGGTGTTPTVPVSPAPADTASKTPVTATKASIDDDNERLIASQKRAVQTLEDALRKASPEARPALEKALERAKKAYEQALERSRAESEHKTKSR